MFRKLYLAALVLFLNFTGGEVFAEDSSKLCIDRSFDVSFTSEPFRGKENILVLANGQILLADRSGFQGVPPALVRLNSDGTIDQSYSSPVFNSFASIEALAEQADGKVLLGGDFVTVDPDTGAESDFKDIVRLNRDGTLDEGFDVRDAIDSTNLDIRAIKVLPNGKILVSGSLVVNGQRTMMARLNSDGTLDTGFEAFRGDDAGFTTAQSIRAIAIQEDGKIVVGGTFQQVTALNLNHMARLLPDGTTDPSFNAGVSRFSCCIWHISIANDGSIFVAGNFSINSGEARYLAKLLPTGKVDPSFKTVVSIGVRNVLEMDDGRLLINGGFNSVNGDTIKNLALLTAGGDLAQSFPSLSNFLTGVSDLEFDLEGRPLFSVYRRASGGSSEYENKVLRLKNDCPNSLNSLPSINSLLLFDDD